MDFEKYRRNAAAVVFKNGKVLMFSRADSNGNELQFPQGGIEEGESPAEAARRELFEETGIKSVKLVLSLDEPICYDYPPEVLENFAKRGIYNLGQAQYWSLFYFEGDESEICFDCGENVELSGAKWVDVKDAAALTWPPRKNSYTKMAEVFAFIIAEYED